MRSPTTLPPKMLEQYAERARKMDGCVRIGTTGEMYEFAQGSNVICLVSVNPPIGHYGKDARRADDIRRELRSGAPANGG
jgi:hypothetical protein